VVDDEDLPGEPFGFLDVLGGQQQAGALGGQLAEDLPQRQPAAGVQPGGRLIEEQHRGRGQQARGDIQAAAHAPGVGAHQAACGAGEAEPDGQLPGTLARPAAGETVEAADHDQVLLAGQERVHRRVLPGQADQPPHRPRLLRHIEPGDPRPAPVRFEQGGQDPHHRRLPRAVRAQQPQHAARWQLQVHTIKREHRPEALAQPLGHDHRVRHLPASSPPAPGPAR
jgi:hypothetical protein